MAKANDFFVVLKDTSSQGQGLTSLGWSKSDLVIRLVSGIRSQTCLLLMLSSVVDT